MTNTNVPQWEEREDKEVLGNVSAGNIPDKYKSEGIRIEYFIHQAIQEERQRIVEMIREHAEPYDGAKWLNSLDAQKIINLIHKE